MLPKYYQARKGDVLVLHAVVQYDPQSYQDYLNVKGHYQNILIDPESVEALAWIGVEAGEEVWVGAIEGQGTVVAVDGDNAWIRGRNGVHFVIPTRELTRVPSPQQMVAE